MLSPALQYRFPEIDVLRTVAVFGMIIYHIAYDLYAFYSWDFDPLHGSWWLFARMTAVLFLLVSGASNTIANDRATTKTAMWQRTAKRAAQIACGAALISLVTYFFDAQTYVRFGILHCIAVSIFLLPLFSRFREGNVLIGLLMIILGNWILGRTADTSLLLPFGWMPPSFTSLDYFPLLPWFGVVLLGSAIADFLYIRKGFKGMSSTFQFPAFTFLNRHALIVYLVHQPIILLLLAILLGKPK